MDKIAFALLITLVLVSPGLAVAKTSPWQPYVAEASQRFGIPELWIRTVIQAESGWDVKAVSPKGAMGLMQLMPDTWNLMRSSHALGPDPFDPHDNIMAGTAFLKILYAHFGYPALFAAYNAGEARYENHFLTGKPLPKETRLYVAEIGRRLGFEVPDSVKTVSGTRLFFALSTVENVDAKTSNTAPASALFIQISPRKAIEK